MRKIMNAPDTYVDDALAGILAAHPEHFDIVEGDIRALIHKSRNRKRRVGLITGGGFGHLPLFLGYVGGGLLTGAAVGNVFASPGAETIARVMQAADSGDGVVSIIGNYAGDRLNFELAAELSGLNVETIIVADDVASASFDFAEDRRGIAGLVLAFKIAGALADEGLSLAELVEALRSALDGMRSMGVALGSCVIPAVGTPSFVLDEGSMEVGMGIHGEPGVRSAQLASATEIAEELLAAILPDFGAVAPERVAVMVNGLGATSSEELYILFGAVRKVLDRAGIEVAHARVGEFATSMEMSGASVTLLRLDATVERCLTATYDSPLLSLL